MAPWADIDGFAILLGALLVLTLPIPWLISAILAALFHECCHALAVKLLGGKILNFTLGLRGIRLDCTPLPPGKALIASLAGPLGSFSLLLFARYIPTIALCAGVQGLFNLLPIYPLDGGRILMDACSLILPEDRASKVCHWTGTICSIIILVLALIASIRTKLGIFPILAAWMLRKIPCKDANLRVQ